MSSCKKKANPKARKPERRAVTQKQDEIPPQTYANVNLKVTEDEKWAFKEWCVLHRMTQVDAFREAFKLLQAKHAGESQK